VEWGFFPLERELRLVPADLAPRMEEALCRLSGWAPFPAACQLLEDLWGVHVSESTGRRHTLRAGEHLVAAQEEEVERIERELPDAPSGPGRAYVSADGAMVPLVHAEWGEVKTLVIGSVEADAKGEVHVSDLSYFSRLQNAETFTQQALYEVHRRGIENSKEVGAPADGAEWIQGFFEWHCPKALRILDFGHAGERVGGCAHALFGEEAVQAKEWTAKKLHALKKEGPKDLLEELRRLSEQKPEVEVLAQNLAYLSRRVEQMRYPTFQQAGWPIGSGPTESANKLVVEARLKGAGMHWARRNVNPMLALRNTLCNDRWDEAWTQIAAFPLKTKAQARRESPPLPEADTPALPNTSEFTEQTPERQGVANNEACPNQECLPEVPDIVPISKARVPEPAKEPNKPAAGHPWRHSPIGKARTMEPRSFNYAKN
jgi:hypothetical protein